MWFCGYGCDWSCRYFLVLMLASPWQFAPPTEPDGMDGQISNPSMFVPPAAAAKAYLITELGNIFPVEEVATGQGPINNQDRQATPTPSAWRSARP